MAPAFLRRAKPPSIQAGMHLSEIWRYPVKSMAGEQVEEAVLFRDGVPGSPSAAGRGGGAASAGRS